jgi:hypothetical protein
MKRTILAVSLLAATLPAAAVTQQERMKACNTEAASRNLEGGERKGFMKNCLSVKKAGDPEAKPHAKNHADASPGKARAHCERQANKQDLIGKERSKFVKQCSNRANHQVTRQQTRPAATGATQPANRSASTLAQPATQATAKPQPGLPSSQASSTTAAQPAAPLR